MNHEGLRGCVLRMVIDQLPKSGTVVIVGHSLGSLIAIDLLDHLRGTINVRRLVTIGSPAGHLALLGKKNPLLRKFPLSRVMSWANLWSLGDPVCYGCGIAHYFPHALDVRIALGMCEHGAEGYLRNQKVGRAIGDAIFGSRSREIAPLETAVDVPLDDQERLILAALAYAYLLADQLKDDPPKQHKFRAGALAEVKQSLIDSVVERCQSEQRAVPAQFRETACELPAWRRIKQSGLYDVARSIPAMLAILGGNVIAPYEIITKDEQRKLALEGLAGFLDLPRGVGTAVFDALAEARKAIKESGSWAPLIGLAAGAALVALGPLGLMMAAPAHLAGGAAIVGALARFGFGGMVGGLAAAGGLMAAGGGAAGAAINALALGSEASVEHTVAQLLATAIARHKLGLPRYDRIWLLLCELESQIARQRQGLVPFSDADAPSVKALERKAGAVRRAIEYLVDHGLAPLLP